MRAVERVRKAVLERHRQLERLPGIAQVRFTLAWKLARLGQWDEIGAHGIPPLLGCDEAERRLDAGGFGHEHRPDPQLLRELARVQRPRAPECDERESGRIVAALDRDDA